MLNWFYKYPGAPARPKPASPAQDAAKREAARAAEEQAAAARAQQAALKAQSKLQQAEQDQASWAPRLQDALGNDAALLAFAQETPVLALKLAAVEALASEDALKQAERAFRQHDRKIHRLAKQRHEAAVATREARAKAHGLIANAQALADAPLLAANQLVALDRDWQALGSGLLEPAQYEAFNVLRERLSALTRERGDQAQRVQRWLAEAAAALAALKTACLTAAAEGEHGALAAAVETATALQSQPPESAPTAALGAALTAALHSAEQVRERLLWLETAHDEPAHGTVHHGTEGAAEPPAVGLAQAESPTDEQADRAMPSSPALSSEPSGRHAEAPVAAPLRASTPTQRWHALPPVADGELAALLMQRFEAWQRAHAPAAGPVAATPRAAPRARPAHASPRQRQEVETLLLQAEATLAEGQLAPLQQQLQAVDDALAALHGISPNDTLRSRQQALHAEFARLRAWQQWGGGRARDDLVDEAEALARFTALAADPQASGTRKLNLKDHADALQAMRKRWKELDRLGAAASQALWQRFDVALTLAHAPVAAQQAELKAARAANLAAREALLTELEAQPTATPEGEAAAAHWRTLAHALENFQRAWRQLGPVEHTVPNSARAGLLARLNRSVEALELPLQATRSSAEAAREALITRAEALLQEVAAQPPLRDALPRLRELQTEWQQQARHVPLARKVENALWQRFKAAGDAVFAQRDAAHNAREAQWAGNVAAREALLARLTSISYATPAAEIRRTLAEVDQAWRQSVELPRGAEAGLHARLLQAHEAALKTLAGSAQSDWAAQCESLSAKLSLCEEREVLQGDATTLAERWAAQPALPQTWERALAQRWAAPVAAGPLGELACNDLLLQLETALDLPATPERQAARRDLKLRAMKDALEGRGAANLDPSKRAEWWCAVLRQCGMSTEQRERLHTLVDALRNRPPGSLATAATPAAR